MGDAELLHHLMLQQSLESSKVSFIDGNADWVFLILPGSEILFRIYIAYLAGYKRIDSKQVFISKSYLLVTGDVPFTDEFGTSAHLYS